MGAQINATRPNVVYATNIKDLKLRFAQFTPHYDTQMPANGVIDAIIGDLT